MRKHKFTIESLNNLENMVSKIVALLNEMEEISLEAGIPKVKYNYILKGLEKQSEEYQEILFNWMVRFYDNEYKEAKIMWNKMSPHGWRNLKELLGVREQPEQILLGNRFRDLRTAWFSRPRPVKKSKLIKEI